MKILACLIVSTAIILSGCGSGGGGGGSGSPTVSPTYATLDTLVGLTTFATTGAVFNYYNPDTPAPMYTAASATISIAYDPTSKTYTLNGAPSGSTTPITQTFGPSDLQTGGNYAQLSTSSDGTTLNGRLSFIGKSPTQSLSLASNNIYSGIGEWENGSANINTGVQNFSSYEFAYGVGTQAGDLPRSGSATYSLTLYGQEGLAIGGVGSLTADFAAGTVTLTITPADVNESEDGVVSQTPITTLTGSGSIDSTANSFSANVTSTNYTGVVKGLFYGPQAAEAGAAFTMNPLNSSVFTVAAGSALGRKQASI